VKFLIWSIPTIGFIGTVVGIGAALLATMDVDSMDAGLAAMAKSEISSNIGVAFDTTLVALVLSLLGMFAYHMVEQVEEAVLGDARAETQRRFVLPGKVVGEAKLAEMLANELEQFRRDRGFLTLIRRDMVALLNKQELNKSGKKRAGWLWLLTLLLVGAAAAGWLWWTQGQGR
jgi:hypothetical protein